LYKGADKVNKVDEVDKADEVDKVDKGLNVHSKSVIGF